MSGYQFDDTDNYIFQPNYPVMRNIPPDTIHSLTEYIELNACSLTSSGLYEGKAGHALCLFEMARHFNDERLEEAAMDNLQEAMITTSKRADFGFGLSGIGYALLYLIDNGFVKADYDLFFGEQTEKTGETIRNSNTPGYFFDTLPFWAALSDRTTHRLNPVELIGRISGDAIDKLLSSFQSDRWYTAANKKARIDRFGEVLKTLCFLERKGRLHLADLTKFPQLCRQYESLCCRRLIGSRYEIGFYLKQIAGLEEMSSFAENQESEMLGAFISETCDLKTLIRLSVMTELEQKQNVCRDCFTNYPEDVSDRNIDWFLDYRIPTGRKRGSLTEGIPLFLLFWLFSHATPTGHRPERLLFFLI